MWKLVDFKLRAYKKWRSVGIPLMTGVGETLPSALFKQAAEDLRMLSRDQQQILCDSEQHVSYIFDRAIHDIPWPKKRWIEYLCDEKTTDYTSEEQEFLRAHRGPFFSLYEVLEAEQGRGVWIKDLFGHQELFVFDIGFGYTGNPGVLLATRIISLENLHFTGGVAMAFEQGQKRQLTDNFLNLYEQKRGVMTWEEMMRKYCPYFMKQSRKSEKQLVFV